MRKLLWLLVLLWAATSGYAQPVVTPPTSAMACVYNSSLPTLAAGSFGQVQCDIHGQLLTNGGGGGGGGPITAPLGVNTIAASVSVTPATSSLWTISSPDTVGTLTALGHLNDTASITINGQQGVSMQLSAGTLIGTIIPQLSNDGGATWYNSYFYDANAVTQYPSITFAVANTVTELSIPVTGGASNARVKVSVYTSGSANAQLRATTASINFPISAQGTATLGQVGLQTLGAVTTSAPTYVTGLSYPPSLKTNGSLRVDATDGAVVGFGVGTSPSGANWIMDGVLDSSGNVASLTLSGANGTGLKVTPDPQAPLGVTSTDAHGTVVTGGTFQSVFAASGTRKGCTIQNPVTATETLFVYFGANGSATTSNSIGLPPSWSITCAVGETVLQDNVSVTGATSAHAYVAFSQ